MTRWVIKTEFVTETPLEHGNWSAVEFDNYEEALLWWCAPDTKSSYHRHITMTDPEGRVVAGRHLKFRRNSMSDYLVNLKQDWNDLLEEIGTLLQKHPDLTAVEICEITGADYEDVLWAMVKAK